MISQTFLDLTVLLLDTGWDLNYNEVEVQSAMEEYFDKQYDLGEVKEAIDKVVTERLSNVEYPNDYIN